MTFEELLEEVYIITNRRDLVGESKSGIKAATLKAHKTDFYAKDLYEEGIQFDNFQPIQSLDYVSLFTNFRAWKYFKRVENSTDQLGKQIRILSVDETLDDYGTLKSDIAYVAGRVLEIRAAVNFDKALIGCYVYPIVTETNYRSWVAEQYPFFIIRETARTVFASIGKIEESRAQGGLVGEELELMRIGALTDVGY